MRPSLRSNADLLEWAMHIIVREQSNKLYGTISFQLENGVIIRIMTNKSELPTFELDKISERN